jgi:hypothetical protein
MQLGTRHVAARFATIVLILTACSHPHARTPLVNRGVIIPPALSGAALVWKDAWLDDGSHTGNHVRVHGPTTRIVGDVVAFPLLVDHGDTVLVTPIPWTDGYCTDQLWKLGAYAIELTVRREDLAPVTAHEVTRTFDDGTSITLRAGVPLGASDPREVRVDGFRFSLAFGAGDDADYSFAPSRDLTRKDAPFAGTIETGAKLHYGDREIDDFPSPTPVETATPSAGGTMIELSSRCARLKLLARPDDVKRHAFGRPMGGDGGTSYSGSYAEKDAVVYWPDGRVAGRLREKDQIGPSVGEHGGHTCYAKTLSSDPADGKLIVCFDPKDVGTETSWSGY